MMEVSCLDDPLLARVYWLDIHEIAFVLYRVRIFAALSAMVLI